MAKAKHLAGKTIDVQHEGCAGCTEAGPGPRCCYQLHQIDDDVRDDDLLDVELYCCQLFRREWRSPKIQCCRPTCAQIFCCLSKENNPCDCLSVTLAGLVAFAGYNGTSVSGDILHPGDLYSEDCGNEVPTWRTRVAILASRTYHECSRSYLVCSQIRPSYAETNQAAWACNSQNRQLLRIGFHFIYDIYIQN